MDLPLRRQSLQRKFSRADGWLLHVQLLTPLFLVTCQVSTRRFTTIEVQLGLCKVVFSRSPTPRLPATTLRQLPYPNLRLKHLPRSTSLFLSSKTPWTSRKPRLQAQRRLPFVLSPQVARRTSPVLHSLLIESDHHQKLLRALPASPILACIQLLVCEHESCFLCSFLSHAYDGICLWTVSSHSPNIHKKDKCL